MQSTRLGDVENCIYLQHCIGTLKQSTQTGLVIMFLFLVILYLQQIIMAFL